jgi:MFS transporter, SP family, inositol transporter
MLRSTAQGFVFTFGRLMAAATSAIIPAVIAFSPSLIYIVSAVAALLGIVVAWIGFGGGRIANEFQHEQEPDPEFAGTSAAA